MSVVVRNYHTYSEETPSRFPKVWGKKPLDERKNAQHLLQHMPDCVCRQCFDEVPTVFLAPYKCLGKVERLPGCDVAWERWFSWVHNGFDNGWSVMGECLAQHGLGLVRLLDNSVAERSFSLLDRVKMFVKPMAQPILRRSR
jgi:hypothetical protein